MAVSCAVLPSDISPILADAVDRVPVSARVPAMYQVSWRVILARHAGSDTTTTRGRTVETCARAMPAVLDGCMPDMVVNREVYE